MPNDEGVSAVSDAGNLNPMPTPARGTGTNWGLILSLQSGVIFASFSVGFWVGATPLGSIETALRSHENIEVHDGAVRRPVYEAEQRVIRENINELLRRLERLEEIVDRR